MFAGYPTSVLPFRHKVSQSASCRVNLDALSWGRYSTETNRGHDSYNISVFDMHDTYLPQYQRAFEHANPPPYGGCLLFVCLNDIVN
jgi:hypothetical protein